MKFHIISTGYNCSAYVRRCVESVRKQTYKNWRCSFFVDGNETANLTSGTLLTLFNVLDSDSDNFYVRHSPENLGAAARRFELIKELVADDEIIVLLGLDDELLPDALETIAKAYERGAWVTYGNWINQHGGGLPPDFQLEFDEATHFSRDYRKVKYRSTAPNTFYKKLFDTFTEEDFKYKGEWIRATTESNLMLSCLEMAGASRIGVIKKPIYVYNQNRTDNARRRFGNEYQDAIYRDVASKPKRDLIKWE